MAIVLKSNVKFTGDISGLPSISIYDGLTNALSLTGTRKLRSGYAGALLRVSRSDNTEKDIFALADGSLDIATLTTFAAGSDLTVPIVYDQSGNGRNLKRSTKDNQPFIFRGGQVTKDSNGKPCLFFGEGTATRAMFVDKPPTGLLGSIGVLAEGVFTNDIIAVLDERDVTKTVFRLGEATGNMQFLYRNSLSDTVKTMSYGAKNPNSSKYFAAINTTTNKATIKSSSVNLSENLVNYSPITVREIVVGASLVNGGGVNLQGYISSLAIVNVEQDINELSKIA